MTSSLNALTMPPPIIYKRKRWSWAGRRVREKVARQLEQSMAAFLGSSQILSAMPPESQNLAPDLNAVILHLSQATLESPDTANLVPVIDLVSDSEVDSEAETLIMMETYSRIRISRRGPASRFRILRDRILRVSEHIDISQFFRLSTPSILLPSHTIADDNDLNPPNLS